MTASPEQSSPHAQDGRGLFGGHPRGLPALFFTELWERFSYYGMRALLMLFMVTPVAAGGLGLSAADAGAIYGTYTFSVYLLPILGGFIADAVLGARRAVLIGGTVIALGHFTLAVPSLTTFYVGLALIALGTGLFKPSISALVGALYATGDERRDAGFFTFYMGINVGALLAPLVTGFLAQNDSFKGWLAAAGLDPAMSWHWGFAAAGVGMTIALIVFRLRGESIGLAGSPPATISPGTLRNGLLVLVGTLLLMGLVLLSDQPGWQWLRWSFIALPAAAAVLLARSRDPEFNRLAAVAVFFIAAMAFFAVFEQAGSTIALFADTLTERSTSVGDIPSAWFQSLNPLFVILLAPLFAAVFLRLGPRQPSSAVKFALGLFFLGLSFMLMVPAAQLTAEGKISPLWLVGLFLLQTIGELFLSPVGLSLMTKLAPARFVSLVLGVWFLAAALGNKLAGVLVGSFTATDADALSHFFLAQAGAVLALTAALFALVPWLRRQMHGVA